MAFRARACLLAVAAFVACASASPAGAVGAPFVVTQAPCTEPCQGFHDADPIAVTRSIAFDAPTAGRALVTFHGSMVCWNSPGHPPVVIDLASAITTRSNSPVDPEVPSGLRHATVVPGDTSYHNESFNLDSQLVFNFANAGTRNFFFRIVRQRMDPGSYCDVYNAAFSIEFVPSTDNGVIVTQAPCAKSGFCLSFSPTGTIPTIRTLTFKAPGPGNAVVSFHGTLYCANGGKVAETVDLQTEIVTVANAVANEKAAGGLRFADVLPNTTNTDYSRTSNLASTRVVAVPAAGNQTYYFKIKRVQMGADTGCYVYNAAFTARFVAKTGLAEVTTLRPCTIPSGASSCRTISASDTKIVKLASISVTPNNFGNAIVTFHGSLTCKSAGTSASSAAVRTQITDAFNKQTTVTDGPGFLLEDSALPAPSEITVNLASTRVQQISKGQTQTFYMLFSGPVQHVTCDLYNAAMTVTIN